MIPLDLSLVPGDSQTDHTEEALAALRRALDDPVVEVRREAALALGQLADVDSAPALTARLTSDSEPVRRAAALALGRIPTPEARKALLESLRTDSSVWREAAVALSKHREPEVFAALGDLLAEAAADEHARRGAALALGALLAGEPLSMRAAVTTAFEDVEGHLHVLL
jgi:HEAT repeat protein